VSRVRFAHQKAKAKMWTSTGCENGDRRAPRVYPIFRVRPLFLSLSLSFSRVLSEEQSSWLRNEEPLFPGTSLNALSSTAEINFTLFELHWKLLSLCSINAIGRTIANQNNFANHNALELRIHRIFCPINVYYDLYRNIRSIIECYVTYWHGNAIYMSA